MAGAREDWSAGYLPAGLTAVTATPLDGGVNSAWRCRLTEGREVFVKASSVLPGELFASEAAALAALHGLGGLPVPEVLAVTARSLVLEALDTEVPESGTFWADAGRAVARLHLCESDRFGWADDGWFGLVRQHNTWAVDGHEFFATQRILSFLAEPMVDATLTAEERRSLERICARLPELVRDTGARLNHGDLWRNNVLVGRDGTAAFIDPAISYCWPEADLCLARGLPDAFFAGYAEVRPLEPGWRDEAPILYLRQLLSGVAHFGADGTYLPRLRETLARYG